MNVGEYLLRRLNDIGLEHVFGVPGDFALTLNRLVTDSKNMKWIGTCGELGASYAADGYARIKGAGAIVTTYAVGELSALNGIAGAFTERVPVAIITGAPPRSAYHSRLPLHHTLGDYDIPRQIFERVTVDNACLFEPQRAAETIDRVLAAMIQHQQPVYLSIPSDVVLQPCGHAELRKDWKGRQPFATDNEALNEAVQKALDMINQAKFPIVLVDVEIARYGLQARLKKLIESSGLPYGTLMMGKCIMDEEHPQNIGLYMGRNSREYVQKRVEDADVVLQLGVFNTDLNTGGFSMEIEKKRTINAVRDSVQIGSATYHNVFLGDFIDALTSRLNKRNPSDLDLKPAHAHAFHKRSASWSAKPSTALKLNRFFDKIATFVPEGAIIIAETGNALFGAAETLMPKHTSFLSQVFYGSIGYTLPAALGASLASPQRPVILFIGDGSFQVTAQELSSLIRYGANVLIFLINNQGYTIERLLVEGPYNDIQPWRYCNLGQDFGSKFPGACIKSEEDLENLLREDSQLLQDPARFGVRIAEIQVDKNDCVQTLVKVADSMRKRIEDGVPKEANLPSMVAQQ